MIQKMLWRVTIENYAIEMSSVHNNTIYIMHAQLYLSLNKVKDYWENVLVYT